jgi:ABC-type nitrate/sulfonate/bicarbonate transport system substrate-binding protein
MPQLDRLVVSTFPNAKALPLWVAQEQGQFQQHGLSVSLDETESSKAQRQKLIDGDIHIAQAAVDNAVALACTGHDVAIIMGGESGMNDFIVQDDIDDFRGMAGRSLVVDSPDTAYALQARTLLSRAGLAAGTDYRIVPVGNASLRLKAMMADRAHGGAVMNPPFSSEAQLRGMRSLGRLIDLLGPYQAGGAFVMRAWAHSHAAVLESYMQAYVAALRWLADPAHRKDAVLMLQRHLDVSPEVATAALQQLTDPDFGFTPEARLDMAGMRNMLDIRAEAGGGQGPAIAVEQIVDLAFYERAMSRTA